MTKYGPVHAPGVTLCLPFHCLIIQVPFLWFISQKETEGEKGKGSSQQGCHFSGSATVPECGHNKQAREAQAGQVSP